MAHRLAVLHACSHGARCPGRQPQTDAHQWLLGACTVGTPPAAHASTEALAGGGGVFSSRTCNQHGHESCPHQCCVACILVAPCSGGVIRRVIRTNGCLGRAQEVPPAAHASTEALAGGAELKASRTCTHPLRRRRHPHESHRWWRRGQMAEAVREGTAPAVLGSGGGVDGVGGGDGGGHGRGRAEASRRARKEAAWRRESQWSVAKSSPVGNNRC